MSPKSKVPTDKELEEISLMFDDNYQPKYKAGDTIKDAEDRFGIINDVTVYEGVWYSINWIGSSLPDKIWNAKEIDDSCKKA